MSFAKLIGILYLVQQNSNPKIIPPMKHALKLVIFAGFVAMMGSCVNTLEMAIPNNPEATNADAVATAIDYFNFHARELLTRAT